MTSPSQSFDGLRVRDKTGKDTTSATVVVSRKGVKLSGARGTLGNFPFQSITSWSHAADDALASRLQKAVLHRAMRTAEAQELFRFPLRNFESCRSAAR